MNIPANTLLGFLGGISLIVGAFLILAGFGIISVEKITVKKGKETFIIGVVFLVLGIVGLGSELFPDRSEMREVYDSSTRESSEETHSAEKVDVPPSTEEISPSTNPASEVGEKFFDDFEMGPKADWKPVSGDWTVVNGEYIVATIEAGNSYQTFLGEKQWTDLSITAEVELGALWSGKKHYGDVAEYCDIRICPRMIDIDNGVCFWAGGEIGILNRAGFQVIKDGTWGQALGETTTGISKAQPIQIRVEVKNNIFSAYINDKQIAQIYDTTFQEGKVLLSQHYNARSGWSTKSVGRTSFDNIEVSSLD